ncbi:MAG: hypothetical protein AAB524_00685 [Patescibacteria group bacterium]
MFKGNSMEGVDVIALRMRAKKAGLATIFRKIRGMQLYALLGDWPLFSGVIRTLKEARLSFSRSEVWRVRRFMKDDNDKKEINALFAKIARKAHSRIRWAT